MNKLRIEWYTDNGFAGISSGSPPNEKMLFECIVHSPKYNQQLTDERRQRGPYFSMSFYGGSIKSSATSSYKNSRGEPDWLVVQNIPNADEFIRATNRAEELRQKGHKVSELRDLIWEDVATYDRKVRNILNFQEPPPKQKSWKDRLLQR